MVLLKYKFFSIFFAFVFCFVFVLAVVSCKGSKKPEPVNEVNEVKTDANSINSQVLNIIPDVTLLPPIGDSIELTGDFDDDVGVTIEIFDLNVVSGKAEGTPIGPTFSTADGSISVTYDPGAEEKYSANWKISDSNKPDGSIVRVELRLGNVLDDTAPACNDGADVNVGCIAYFDVQLWKNQGQAKRADGDQDDIIDLGTNQSLPIKFHVKDGAANVPPSVSISNPEDNSVFLSDEGVTFTATAIDFEDGDLSAQISWSSDVIGDLGTGATIITTQLPVGTHVITASVTDGTGAIGNNSSTIKVAVPLPTPWQGIDIGGTGKSSYNSDVESFNLNTSPVDGKGIHFVYQELSGDFVARGCVKTLSNTDPEAKAGLMLRQDNTDTSQYVFVGLTQAGSEVNYVDDTGTVQTIQGQQGISTPRCYKLEREENSVRVYESDDGLNWVLITTVVLSLVDPIHIGLAVCASEEVQAVVDDVLVEAQGPPEVLTLEPGGFVVGIDGITILADEPYFAAHLDETVQFTIERYDEAFIDLSVKEPYVVKSHAYRLRVLPSSENKHYNLVIGIPVPEGVDPNRAEQAAIIDTAKDITDSFPPYYRYWSAYGGLYDEDSNLLKK